MNLPFFHHIYIILSMMNIFQNLEMRFFAETLSKDDNDITLSNIFIFYICRHHLNQWPNHGKNGTNISILKFFSLVKLVVEP